MLPEPAQYLLRIDDLCPTMAAGQWKELAALIEEFSLRPLLAIVPENRDPELRRSRPDPDFWSRMRELQKSGAAIGLHGYTHLCASRGAGLVRLSKWSEFAGVEASVQKNWIRRGIDRLRGEGLEPVVWAAPRHGFDRNTIRALREEGIEAISDGFARRPFVREGMVWIPQQHWAPTEHKRGVWTICLHPNTASREEIQRLRGFLGAHAERFSSVRQILAAGRPRALTVTERVYGAVSLQRIRCRRLRSRLLARTETLFRA